MNVGCTNCGYVMKDDLYCLGRMPLGDDAAALYQYFEGYHIELWKCPECGWHKVIIEKHGKAIYFANFPETKV